MLILTAFVFGCGAETADVAGSGNNEPSPSMTESQTSDQSVRSELPSNGDPATAADESVVAASASRPRPDSASEATSPLQDTTASVAERQTSSDDATIRILSWNVESEGSDPNVIASQLRELGKLGKYDVIALTEVLPEAASRFAEAPLGHYDSIATRSGYNDRMQIIYDAERFELVRRLELDEINNDRHRSPLVAHLRDKRTGLEFLVMVNHLARGDAEYRTTQARQLVDWARNQSMPLVAVGDYNFDFDFATGNGNEGFRAMLRDNIFRWVRPTELIDSNWYDPEPDGKDNFPGSLLDFAFVAGPATQWDAVCRIIVRPGDFPDDETTSDHRPFELILKPN